MTVKEMQNRVGGLSSYIPLIILVFCWYFMDNLYNAAMPLVPGSGLETLLYWMYRLLAVPLMTAGVYGGIHNMLRRQEISSINAFFDGAKDNYWRVAGANLLSTVFIMIITVIILLAGGAQQPDLEDNKLLQAMVTIPYAAISLFWFTGIVMERKIFRGLFRGIRILFSNPLALAIGILWGMFSFADTLAAELQMEQTILVMSGASAGVLALGRILVTVYAFALYEKFWGFATDGSIDELAEVEPASPGDKLVKASVGFTFVSFLPVLHLVALVLGILAMKRKKQFVLSAAVACCAGAFFTLLYAFVVVGWMISAFTPSNAPTYAFLRDVNPALDSQVTLLEQGQVIQSPMPDPNRHWSGDFVSAVAKYQAYDSAGALEDFHTGAEKDPDRSEFYYFYGVLLLENEQAEMAAQQFQTALRYDPGLKQAQLYLDLIDSTYTPSLIISSMGFVIILLLLFTLHEYGHAFAAWKLGDNTAKDLGRLTLNPVPHLDLFGSLILPAILLFQQAEVLFGWAKPVPVNPANFKDPKKDHMRVSFAGPAMNLLVAMACFIVLGFLILFLRLFWPGTLSLNLATPFSSVSLAGLPFPRFFLILIVFLKQFFYSSLALGFFNLLPVPPLDGSWILSGLLPDRFGPFFEKIRQFGFLIFLLLVISPVLDYLMVIPIGFAWGGLSLLVSAMGLG
jgi:Zn-dependent protease